MMARVRSLCLQIVNHETYTFKDCTFVRFYYFTILLQKKPKPLKKQQIMRLLVFFYDYRYTKILEGVSDIKQQQ